MNRRNFIEMLPYGVLIPGQILNRVVTGVKEINMNKVFNNAIVIVDNRGYSSGDIEKILGQNWHRYFRDTL